MSLSPGRLSYTLSDTEKNDLRAAFGTISTILEKFQQPLSLEERRTLPKIDVSNKAFCTDAINEFENNAELMPVYLKLGPIRTDLQLYEDLAPFVQISRQMTEKLEDTQMLAGSECYQASLMVYRLLEAAVKANLSGADTSYQKLKERFASHGRTAPADTPVGA
jgi:hypothetical protein